MLLTASVIDKETGKKSLITSEYSSISGFRKDLNRNGYRVIGRVSYENDLRKKTYYYNRGIKY